MDLAVELGYTLGELLERMTSRELTLWIAFRRKRAREREEQVLRERAEAKARSRR
jgi:hypothetical protein